MFIKDVQNFINQFKIISEAVTLPQIRRGIVGKEKEIPVIDSDKEWYEEHKKEVLNTIEKALSVDDKTLKIKLQKFDTEDFFTNDKPRKLKIKKLLKSVRKNFISEVERSRMTEEKTTGIEAQFEMMKMKNGVEVYAVYTPLANRYLTHTKLWTKNCFSPTWCIASSTANNYWNHYYLYEADFPSVFIVSQKTKSGYNPIKYELKCNPHNSSQFKNGEITLEEWVDEWREPEQREENYNDTSLFDSFNITANDLENTIRKLLNTKKAEGFSKNYGKEMIGLYTKKIESGDEDTKIEYLTKACKNGTFINFCDKIDEEDKEYFLDELIRYGTLTEAETLKMKLMNNKKALLNLIKNKRCTYLSLDWAKNHFGGNMVKRVYHSLPDEFLLMEDFEGINVRKNIFEAIQDVDGLTIEYSNYLIQKGGVNNTTLEYVSKYDKDLFLKCVQSMIENSKVDYFTLKYVKNDKDLLTKCVDYLIKKGEVDIYTLKYVEKDKELLSKCVDYLIKKDEFGVYTLKFVRNDRELLTKCVDYLIKKGEVDNGTLQYVKEDKNAFSKCLEYLFKNDKVNDDTLRFVEDDKELLTKCIYSMIENDKVDNDTLYLVKNNKELFSKCVEYLIKKDEVNKITLKYVEDDKELLTKCVYSMIQNGRVDNYTLYYYVNKDDKDVLTKCIYSMIQNDKVDNYTLKCVKDDEELLSKCIYSMIENGRVDCDTLDYVKNDKELYLKCKNYLENK